MRHPVTRGDPKNADLRHEGRLRVAFPADGLPSLWPRQSAANRAKACTPGAERCHKPQRRRCLSDRDARHLPCTGTGSLSTDRRKEHPTYSRILRALRPCAIRAVLAVSLLGPAGGASALAQGTAPAMELRREAERLRGERRFGEALQAYRAIVRLEPASFEDRFWVAKLESWSGLLAEAERGLAALLVERPEDYDARIALADVRRWRGDLTGARLVLEDLARTHPDDPEVRSRLVALRRAGQDDRWQADLEYFGERLPGSGTAAGGSLSLGHRRSRGFRWRAAATLQEKFERTETRGGGEMGVQLTPALELTGSVFLAPGGEVMPRRSYGLAASRRLGRLVLYADYGYHDYRDAEVHRLGPALELYAGRWLLSLRYRYAATRFAGAAAAVGDHAGAASLGYSYGSAGLVRVFAAAGGESFTQPSRELIGRFDAHALGVSWRHFVTPGFGLEAMYAHQDRSDGGDQDSWALRLVRRW